MEAENTRNGWELTSRDQALFTKQQHPTAPTRTASQNEQIEQSWKESNRLLQISNSTKGYGWNSWKQSYISKIAAQLQQSPLHLTRPGMASNRTSLTSRSSDQRRMFTFPRKNASNSTPTRTKES